MRYFITGGAGFIGSNMVDRLMTKPENQVTVYDNLSSGRLEFLAEHENNDRFKFIEGDLLDLDKLKTAVSDHDFVFHIAANADIRLGTEKTDTDLDNGVRATYNVLESMRLAGVNRIAFSSSSTVYGEAKVIPTPEDYGPLVPISLYGGSKLGAEALITAFAYTFDLQAWIFRFANIIGRRGTHGVIIDFVAKLRKNPSELEILGDGRQQKSYLLVDECIDSILFAIENANEKVNIFNLGSTDHISVTRIGELVVEEMGLTNVEFKFTGGARGWAGDVPKMLLDTNKIQALGWKSKLNSEGAVRQAINHVLEM
ncbi:NAD-dependent epimerase/dehydratase family protein [[Eubacterium] cellulosolvens]